MSSLIKEIQLLKTVKQVSSIGALMLVNEASIGNPDPAIYLENIESSLVKPIRILIFSNGTYRFNTMDHDGFPNGLYLIETLP